MTLKTILNKLDRNIPIMVLWGVWTFDKEDKSSLITAINDDGCWEEISNQEVSRISMDTQIEPNTMIIEVEI